MFFFEYTIENARCILALAEVAEEHGVCNYDSTNFLGKILVCRI
jgi:hypothetical protein